MVNTYDNLTKPTIAKFPIENIDPYKTQFFIVKVLFSEIIKSANFNYLYNSDLIDYLLFIITVWINIIY